MPSENEKPSCFVIQQFDNDGMFDKRYKETIQPTLIKAGFRPVRADEILGPKPIIEKIENAIRESDICLAEVSTDNPNVWLEVGYAYSLKKPTILLCDKNIREHLPFDIRHRPVIFYTTAFRSGFDDLEKKIIREIESYLSESKRIVKVEVTRPIASSNSELTEAQILILAELLSQWISNPSGTSHWQLKNAMSEYNIYNHELAFGILGLLSKSLIHQAIETDHDGDEFKVYQITPEGSNWLEFHKNDFEMVTDKNKKLISSKELDDEIPF